MTFGRKLVTRKGQNVHRHGFRFGWLSSQWFRAHHAWRVETWRPIKPAPPAHKKDWESAFYEMVARIGGTSDVKASSNLTEKNRKETARSQGSCLVTNSDTSR
jgi:hypothetical protein